MPVRQSIVAVLTLCLSICAVSISLTCHANTQALVHARSVATDVARGIHLAEVLMDKQHTDPQFQVSGAVDFTGEFRCVMVGWQRSLVS